MSLRIVNLSTEKAPKAVENNSRDWVTYGKDDDYFEYLIDRYNGSAVNNAIISSVSDQIYGEGISATNSNKKPLEYAKMRSIFKSNDLRRASGDLKLLGQCAFNVIWNKGRTQILKAVHVPMQNLRPEKATEGEIKGWYYSDKWSEYRKEKYKPKRIETFTGQRGETSQILVIKPYSAGYFYFSPVDYAGALRWAEIDEEIGTYHLENIQNGFAPAMMINFNNGQPTEDEQNDIERRVGNKLQGTKGKKWLISFNDDSSQATTIESLPISEASEQYKFLSEEATRKILIGHKVTSPILFGIKDNTGLGNNADEIKTASQLWDNLVIKPLQNLLLEAINEVLLVNGIVLDTYFKTLQPIEFIETDGLNKVETEKETGIELKQVEPLKSSNAPFLSDEFGDELLDHIELIGEENDDEEWELISEEIIDTTKDGFHQFASAKKSDAKPDKKSKWGDVGLFKVRYAYTKTSKKSPKDASRKFCSRMLELSNSGLEYRFEDIKEMSEKGVNSQFAPKGKSNYDLFKYKGGVNCYHGWMRRIYVRKREKGRILPDAGMKNERKVGNNPFVKQKGEEATAMIDTPNKGRLN
jgi:hypothetical protein